MASSKRERELARRRVERQAARRAEAEARRRRRRALLIKIAAGAVAAAVAVTLIVMNVDFSGSKTAGKTCTYSAAAKSSKPISGLPAKTALAKPKTATLSTNRGTISIALLPDKAPCTVNSFAFLAKQKYFDGTSCHRVTQGGLAVLQCGDPSASGSGGPGYQYADENLTGATYPKGTVAMANAGPNTNGSQFFLVYADSQLGPQYTPFGTITSGLDIVQAVGKAGPTSAADPKPKLPVTLTTVTVS